MRDWMAITKEAKANGIPLPPNLDLATTSNR